MLRAINTAGLTEIETRVVKATYDDYDPPKQKHVEALILLSSDHDLVYLLDKRVWSNKWNVALKGLVVIHRLLLEGSPRLIAQLERVPDLFTLPQLQSTGFDPSDGLATLHVPFLTNYSRYLAAKVKTAASLGDLSVERMTGADAQKWANRLSDAALMKSLPLLQTQFTTLLKCAPGGNTGSLVLLSAMSCISKDAFRIYSVLTMLMMLLLDRYQALTLPQTQAMLAVTHRFILQNRKFRKWCLALVKLGIVQRKLMPNFDAVPTTFLQLLEEHIVALGGAVDNPTPDELVHEPQQQRRSRGRAEPQLDEDEDDDAPPRRANTSRRLARVDDEEVMEDPRDRRRLQQDYVDEDEEEDYEPSQRAPVRQARAPERLTYASAPLSNRTAATRSARAAPRDEDLDDAEEPERVAAAPAARAVRRQPSTAGGARSSGSARLDDLDAGQRRPVERGAPIDMGLLNEVQSQRQEVQRQPQQRASPRLQEGRDRRTAATASPLDMDGYQDEPEEEQYEDQQPEIRAQPPPQTRRAPSQARPSSVRQAPASSSSSASTMPEPDLASLYLDDQHQPSQSQSAADALKMFAPPTPMGQAVVTKPARQVAATSSSVDARNKNEVRDAVRANMASRLQQDLSLFDQFDANALLPAEEEALQRQHQEALDAAFFTAAAPQRATNSAAPSSARRMAPSAAISEQQQPPPPEYDDLNDNVDPLPVKAAPRSVTSRSPAAASSSQSASRAPARAQAAAPPARAAARPSRQEAVDGQHEEQYYDPFTDLTQSQIDPVSLRPVASARPAAAAAPRRTKAQAQQARPAPRGRRIEDELEEEDDYR